MSITIDRVIKHITKISHTIKCFQYTVLEIQFQSVKCTIVTKIPKNFEELLISGQTIKGGLQCIDGNKPLEKVFKRVYTV